MAVADAVVMLVHGRFRAATPPAGEFRRLAVEAFRAAQAQAGTVLCAPRSRVELGMPASALTAALALLGELGGTPGPVRVDGDRAVVVGHLAATQVDVVERRVPDLTSGLDTFLAEPDGDVPVGPPRVER